MAAHTDIEAIPDPLHRVLLRATPPDLSGDVTVTRLAQLVGMSRAGIYKWIQAGRLSPENAIAVVRVARGQVTLDDFHPFVYGLSPAEVKELSRK